MGIRHVLALAVAAPWELRHRVALVLEDAAYVVRGGGKLRAEELEEALRANTQLREQVARLQAAQRQITSSVILGTWARCPCPRCSSLRGEQPS